MKPSARFRRRAVHGIMAILLAGAATRADDLTTRDGKVYKGYKVLGHDAGYVTIMYADGGGKIPLSQLPDELQKKYNYDPAEAAAAIKATVNADQRDRLAIASEANRHQQQMASGNQTLAVNGSPVVDSAKTSEPVAPSSPTTALPEDAIGFDEVETLIPKMLDLEDELRDLQGYGRSENAQKVADDNKALGELLDQGKKLERQLSMDMVKGPRMSAEEIATMKGQVATTEAELVHLREDVGTGKGAYPHMISADEHSLWLMKLKLQYANN